MQRILTAQELEDAPDKKKFLFHKNTRRKNAFLTVCCNLNNEITLRYVNELAEFGGAIDPGNSNLDFFSNVEKCFGCMQFFVMLVVS